MVVVEEVMVTMVITVVAIVVTSAVITADDARVAVMVAVMWR